PHLWRSRSLQHWRVGPGVYCLPWPPAAPDYWATCLQFRLASRRRCGPYRRDRQRDPQADARWKTPHHDWFFLRTWPFDCRRPGRGCRCSNGSRIAKSLRSADEPGPRRVRVFFDVALLDLGLPDARGLDAVRTFIRISPNVPVLVLTDLDDASVGL